MKIFDPDYWKLRKPLAATAKDWREWNQRTKALKPMAYWLQETLPSAVDWAMFKTSKPFRDALWWLRYRTTDKYHVVFKGLEPGYHEKPEQMLHVNMQLLVDFVEIECANMATIFLPEWQNQRKPAWKRWFKIPVRNAAAGLSYLQEQIESNPEDAQYVHEKSEIISIYRWWKTTRPLRLDPYDVSGWSSLSESYREQDICVTDMPAEQTAPALDMLHKLEQTYLDEDQQMLQRLMSVRMRLWT